MVMVSSFFSTEFNIRTECIFMLFVSPLCLFVLCLCVCFVFVFVLVGSCVVNGHIHSSP